MSSHSHDRSGDRVPCIRFKTNPGQKHQTSFRMDSRFGIHRDVRYDAFFSRTLVSVQFDPARSRELNPAILSEACVARPSVLVLHHKSHYRVRCTKRKPEIWFDSMNQNHSGLAQSGALDLPKTQPERSRPAVLARSLRLRKLSEVGDCDHCLVWAY